MSFYRHDKNTGLPTNFNLINGKFELVGGTIKAQDNMRMFMHFMDWYRYYYPDYCVRIGWMLQKPSSFIDTFRNVCLLQCMDAATKYMPFVEIRKANINYETTQEMRKQLMIGFEWAYKLQKDKPFQFVQILS